MSGNLSIHMVSTYIHQIQGMELNPQDSAVKPIPSYVIYKQGVPYRLVMRKSVPSEVATHSSPALMVNA